MCTGSSPESGLTRSHSMYYYIYISLIQPGIHFGTESKNGFYILDIKDMLYVILQKLRIFSNVNLYKMQTSVFINILLEYMHIYLSTYLC